jgi:hypothetical protein
MRTNRGVNALDVPIVFTASATYELPFGKNKPYANTGAKSAIFGGLQVNGIASIHSGTPFTATINFDRANALNSSERPNVSGSTVGPKTRFEYFNTSAFYLQPQYTYGNAGYNSLRGPSYTDFDFSLFRNISFGERLHLQLRAESFNIFNHPNFGTPDGTLEDPTFGQINSMNSSYGPREFQFAGIFKF